jgi:hypothetical protein
MMNSRWFSSWGLVLCVACGGSASGALGPQGYEQSLTQYRVNYADAGRKKFLPDDWALDNYAFDPSSGKWHEKKGDQYRALRLLDEDGDGTISPSEKNKENLFDLRFVNSRDGAVIWLKVHPMEATDADRDLDVILDSYANGLEGSGLFEQSTLFGLTQDKARHFTTFMVKKQPLALGQLPAIRGVIEIADVEKLRLDPTHRDSKAELIFAKVTYFEKLGINKPRAPRWPIVTEDSIAHPGMTTYKARRTGLLVIGYYDDAARFESHLADLHALLDQIVIPDSAIPPNAAPVVLAPSVAPKTPAPEPSVPVEPAASAPATEAESEATAHAAAAPATPSSSAAAPASGTPAPTTAPASKATPAAAVPAPVTAKKK